MSAIVLLDVVRVEHAEKIRKAADERLIAAANQTNRRRPAIISLLHSLLGG